MLLAIQGTTKSQNNRNINKQVTVSADSPSDEFRLSAHLTALAFKLAKIKTSYPFAPQQNELKCLCIAPARERRKSS